MTGVLALADSGTYVQYVGAFFAAILLLAGGLIMGRAVFGARREHGNVLDINSAERAHAARPVPEERKAA